MSAALHPIRRNGWYWVRKEGTDAVYGPWVPAEWRSETRSWYSANFAGIPDFCMIVGQRLMPPVDAGNTEAA